MPTINRKEAPRILAEVGEAVIKGAGNSMQPIISTGDLIYLKKVEPSKLRKGDAVFCKVNGNTFVHLIKAIDSKGERFLIANNRGHTNGWAGTNNIYGLAIQVNDRILISEQELQER